jgi:hypothetical protein
MGRYLVGPSYYTSRRSFAVALTRQRLLRPAFVARFQIERMLLDILDMSSCWTFRLKRGALSIDSPSWILTSATKITPFAGGRIKW